MKHVRSLEENVMSTAVGIPKVPPKNTLLLLLYCGLGFLILASIANLHRSKMVPLSIPNQDKAPTFVTQEQVPVHLATARMALAAGGTLQTTSAGFDRKIVRTGSLQAIVKSPAEAAEKVRIMAEGLGGYVESLQINANQGAPTGNMTIRVPSARLEEAKAKRSISRS